MHTHTDGASRLKSSVPWRAPRVEDSDASPEMVGGAIRPDDVRGTALLRAAPQRSGTGRGESAGDETRTRDHLLGRQGLYQLSYSRVAAYFNPGAVLKTLRAVVDPGLAFGVDLFLPDRHRVLQLVDQPLAGVERLPPMRGRHGDHHADLSHLQGPNPVDHRDVRDRPPPAGLLREAFHLFARHRPIGLVHQCPHLLAARMLADDPLEQHQRPVRIAADPIRNGHRVEGLLAQGYGTTPLADGASAHGRNDGQLVTFFQGVIPARVLRVHRTPEGARKRAKVILGAQLTPGVGGGRPGRQGQINIRLPDQLAGLGEEHHAYLHGVMIRPLVWETWGPIPSPPAALPRTPAGPSIARCRRTAGASPSPG